jgi:hypothetical protein
MLTQLPTVKARLGLAAYETNDDALLANFIRLVSARFELECNRRFARDPAAVYDFPADTLDVRVDRYPVEAVTGFYLKTSADADWTGPISAGWMISPSRSVIALDTPLGGPGAQGRVVFAGGYVLPGGTPAAGQEPLPDDLEQMAVEQVAYLYENRNRVGLLSVGGGSGAIEILRGLDLLPASTTGPTTGSVWFKFAQVDLLPAVQMVLRRYARMLW